MHYKERQQRESRTEKERVGVSGCVDGCERDKERDTETESGMLSGTQFPVSRQDIGIGNWD